MNVILTKTAHDHAKVLWEPFATSTPLKIGPNNAKIENLLHKHLLTDSDHRLRKTTKQLSTSNIRQGDLTESKHLASKKSRKNRSSAFFDLSSSSSDEESGENKKRPIIKIGSKKKTRSFLCNKKPESDKPEVVSTVSAGASTSETTGNSKKVKSSEKNTVPVVKDLKSKNGKGGKKGKGRGDNKDLCQSSDEECKIFDESNKSVVNNVKPAPQSQEGVRSDDAGKTGETKTPKVLLKSKTQGQKCLPKATSKPSKTLKRKGAVANDVEPAKKLTKENSKVQTVTSRKPPSEEKVVRSLHIWQSKRNLSHQLFSDSREQEFINTLDFTSEDLNEVGCIKQSLWQKPKMTPSKKVTSTSGNQDVSKTDEVTQERPVRRKQKPKEFWLPENASPTHSKDGAKELKKSRKSTSTRSNSKRQTRQKEDNLLTEEIKENNDGGDKAVENVRSPKGRKKVKKKKGNVLKEKKLNTPDDAVVSSTNELQRVETKQQLKYLGVDAGVDNDVESNSGVKSAAVQKPDTTDKTVFKLLNEMSFKESANGCSAVQCQSINKFKCGVLKLNVKSVFKCRTLHSNSHLGGVVVKGSLKMKIGEKETDLREGDMAFVPPLTDWQATNIGETESVFYYWCGRFK